MTDEPLITIETIEHYGSTLRVDPPLEIRPTRLKCGQIAYHEESLSISVIEGDDAKLEKSVGEELLFLWREYGAVDPEQLSKVARGLQKRLRARISELS